MNACLICPEAMVTADLSFLPCPCGFVYVSSPLFWSTKTMDVAHDAQLPQTSMRGQVITVFYFFSYFLSISIAHNILFVNRVCVTDVAASFESLKLNKSDW